MEIDWKVLAENGMIQIVDGKESFISGIGTYLTYGHTAGLLHPVITDGNKSIFYGADIIPMVAHIPIPWVMAYDIQPAVTVKEKEKLLTKIVDENWFLFFGHDPNVQACTVQLDGKHFKLKEAITISE